MKTIKKNFQTIHKVVLLCYDGAERQEIMQDLLLKTRKITELLQGSVRDLAEENPYREVCGRMAEVINCNICVIDTEGQLLGYALPNGAGNARIDSYFDKGRLPKDYINLAIRIYDTVVNLGVDEALSLYPVELQKKHTKGKTTLSPIYGSGERLGTLILWREGENFSEEELVLVELATTVMGVQLSDQAADKSEAALRDETVLNMAVGTLSYSELRAIRAILDVLEGTEGRLTASQVADQMKITRSVIVNALRKLESAGVIESRSLGMRGTHIKVLNSGLYEKLEEKL